jgi:DNA-binding NarL/FixJ family response regulator
MEYDLDTAIPLLERTPRALTGLLDGLPRVWTEPNEGPDTWSVHDVVAHLSGVVADVAAGRTAFPTGWERLLLSRLDGHRPNVHRRHDPVALTQRERDIVQLVVDGHSNKALAASLGIAHQTAKNHVRHVMAKVRVNSRVQLCAWAIERGYAPTRTAATA